MKVVIELANPAGAVEQLSKMAMDEKAHRDIGNGDFLFYLARQIEIGVLNP